MHLGAVLTGDVGAEPVVELITDTEPVRHSSGEFVAELVHRQRRCVIIGGREQLAASVGHADIAAQVPAAEILDRRGVVGRRRRRHNGTHVGGERR